MKHIIFALFTIFLYIGNSFAEDCSIKWNDGEFKEISEALIKKEYAQVNLSKIFDDLKKIATDLNEEQFEKDFKAFLTLIQNNPNDIEALKFFIEKDIEDKGIYKDFIKNTAEKIKAALDKRYKKQLREPIEKIILESLRLEHGKALKLLTKYEEDKKKFNKQKAELAKEKAENKGKTASILTSTVTSAVQQYLTHKNSQNRMRALRELQEREAAILNRAAQSQANLLINETLNEFDFHDPQALQEASISEVVEAKNRVDTHINNLDQQKAANIMKRKQLMQQGMAEEQGLQALRQKLEGDLASTEKRLTATFNKAKNLYETLKNGDPDHIDTLKAKAAMEEAEDEYLAFMASKENNGATNMIDAELAKAQAASQLGNINYELSRIDTDNAAIETQINSLRAGSSKLDTWISKKKRASKREIREKEQEEKLRKDAVYAQKSYVPQATRVGTISNGRGTTRTYSKVRGSVR